MIDRIKNNQLNSIQYSNTSKNDKLNTSPNFEGRFTDKAVKLAVKGIQACEKNPMVNVAAIDLITAIGPRSIWESFTNLFAGFEAFRRESSGLLVNCLIPGFVALGAAKAVNKMVMGGKSDMSSCWAGKDTIDMVSDYYNNAEGTDAYAEGMAKFNDPKKAKVYATHYNMLSDAQGVDGDLTKKFKDIKDFDISETAEKLTDATFEEKKNLSFSEKMKSVGRSIKGLFSKKHSPKEKSVIDRAFETASAQTHITENVKFGNNVTSDLKSAMKNTTGILRGFMADGVENAEQVKAFAGKAKKLVNAKSGIAMAIILPLAASMQSINRWITTKMSGVKGAPIYNDYAQKKEEVQKTPEQEKADKISLLKQKFISIGSIVGLSLLSMMKVPTLSNLKNIFQFKGQFPTMDQARAISTFTFGSRMAVAEDKNELAEATVRDDITFASMYFLGDYAAKGYATYLEKKDGVKLLNRTKPLNKEANIFKRFGNWVVNTHLKSTNELVGDSVRTLEDMKFLRNKCQGVNLGSSLLILGLFVPVFTRLKTQKNHKKELLAQEQAKNLQNVNFSSKKGNSDFSGIFNKVNTKSNENSTFQLFRQIAKER